MTRSRSLDAPFTSGTGNLYDLVGRAADPAAALQAGETGEELAARLTKLDPVERAVLVATVTGTVSAEVLALRLPAAGTPERVRQMAERCLACARRERKPTEHCGHAPGAGVEAPLGTVRVRKRSAHHRVRVVKVRMDGPQKQRWAVCARLWWERNRGPVPPDKHVIHQDGDDLNDDPANLALGTCTDRAYLGLERLRARGLDPYARTRAGCAEHNRKRAQARDLLGELRPRQWYAVDHDARTVVGPCGKTRVSVYRWLGFAPPPGWRTSALVWRAVQLGWPGLGVGAVALHCLALAGLSGLTTPVLREQVVYWAARLGQPLESSSPSLGTPLWLLRKAGLIATVRHGVHPAVQRVLPSALALRGPVWLGTALVGRDCETLKLDGYSVDPLPRR